MASSDRRRGGEAEGVCKSRGRALVWGKRKSQDLVTFFEASLQRLDSRSRNSWRGLARLVMAGIEHQNWLLVMVWG